MSFEFLNELNSAQKEAVTNSDGPALVIAGAGAGKTRVLTYRIAWLVQNGTDAGRILALTFTNKAAGEMKERIMSMAGIDNSRYLWMGTFHSIFARILRMESDRLGYPSSYTIYDSTDSRSLIKSIIKEMRLDDKIYKPASVAARISTAKNNLVTASLYSNNATVLENDRINRVPEVAEIYRRYSARCFKSGAMDFDDLLLNTNILLRDFPDVLDQYRSRFSYILVDEYQDTNYSQYLIVKKLSEIHRNLCVVGDDAQSIYSFRGARIENILNFKNDYPDYKLYKLEQNYRSTKTIVNAANSVIKNNRGQIKKTVFSEKETGNKINVFKSMTDGEEGFRIASDIFDRSLTDQVRWDQFAILYRTNAQSRIFEETLRKKNIPYKIWGGLSFYERKEIKDILAYFRIIINPRDEEAFRRTINYPKRGIGKTSIDRILEAAGTHEKPAWSIISGRDSFGSLFTNATWLRIETYTNLVNNLMSRNQKLNAYELARVVINETGISKELREGNTPEEISRYENLQELLNAIKEFTEAAETNGEPSDLSAYMESVALITDMDTEGEDDKNRVILMTVHSAKGLEFRCVYVTGLEENLFPSLLSMSNDKDIEEERRLFYVALTRAKEQATLSYALNRYKWGNLESCKPSRFLDEIDETYLNFPMTGGSTFKGRQTIARERSVDREYSMAREKNDIRGKRNLSKVSGTQQSRERFDYTPDLDQITPGTDVVHERFGRGKVISIDGEAPNTTAVVDFVKGGEKKLLLRFAKLQPYKE